MSDLKTFLNEQINELKLKGESFLKKEVTLHDFKKASGKFGIYAERGGESFMIRIKIPSGYFNTKSMQIVEDIINKYNIENIHLTTRQALQFHRLTLDTVVNIFKECVQKDLISYGCGGNFPRNVTSSPLSSVEKGSTFDVTPYANYVTDYFLKRMDTYNLPRKVKVGFSNSEANLSQATLTDLGFLAVIKDGKKYFKVFVAGGLGKNPSLGVEMPELIEVKDILYYVDALVELFKENGNYENRNKARIRYIVQEKGNEQFIELYKSYIEKSKALDLDVKEVEETIIPEAQSKEIQETNNVIAQKQKGRYTVIIKPEGGNISSEDFIKILNFVRTTKSNDIVNLVVSMEESLYVNNLDSEEAENLLSLVKHFNETTNLNQSLSCIGVPVCQIGLAESQTLLKNILNYFKDKNLNEDILPKIHISGCSNSCSRHQVAQIGFMGKRKMIDGTISDAYELFVDGCFYEKDTKLGKSICEFSAKEIPMFLEKVYNELKMENSEFNNFINTDKFKNICDEYCLK